MKGDSTEQNHVGWFEIEGFDLDVSNPTDASGGGSGAGKAVFSPLSIEMPADGVLAALLAKVATGGHITSIKLQGVAEAGERQDVVYDLTLADVVVQQVQDSNGGGDDRLLFDYGRIGLVTKAQNPQTGALTPSGSFGYDLTQNVAIDPSTLPVPVPGTTLPAATASKFFLLIDGVKGDSTEQNHVGWFEIEGFDLDVSNLTDASGGGSGAGKAVFSPLSIEMPADGVLAALLAKVATGGHITSIKLQGVAEAGERQDVVYDLILADVVVQQVQDSNGVGDDRLLFDYGRIGLVTKAQNPQTGALTPSGSFGYDLTQNVAIDPSTLPVPVPGTVLPAATASKFFLLIDGVKGDSTEQNHVGWFEIEGFDLDVSNPTDASGGGSGAGKAVFSPLSIEMPADGVLAALLAKVATGGHITSIKLQGVAEAGERQDVVYDLTLADVVVQQVQDSNGGGDDRLLFDYGRIGLVTKAQNPQTGALTPSGRFGYDLTQNVVIDPATLPVPTTDIPLEAELVSTTAHGQLTLNADGSFVYVPDPNFSGEDFFVYRARQGDTLSEEITVRLVVAPVNDAPVLGDMTVDAQENAGNPIIISTDVVDPDAGQTHSFVFDTAATIGQVTDNGDGTFGYTPNGKFEAAAAGATAVDSFNITVTDDGGLSSTATVTIRVHGENDAPIAGNVSGQTSENTGNPIQLTALFTDVDIGDTHTFQIETSGTKGTVSNNADGTFSYDPNGAFEWLGAGETALDSFVFKVIDNSGAVSTATATIVIQGENDTPLPTADVAVVRPGSAISVAVSNGVLSNDHDPDANDQLSVSGVSFGNTTVAVSAGGSAEVKGAYGTLTIRSDGSFAYAANNSVSSQGLAQDTFEYMTSDGHGGTAQATLTVAVTKEGYVLGAPGDTLTGGTGKQILDGSLGQQQLLGGNGKDILVGGPEDVLTGGNGPDTFVFREGFGHVTITDFKTRNDVIQWDKNIFANVASIFDHIASDGHGGTIISVDEENSVSLLGVNPASLHKGDFLIM